MVSLVTSGQCRVRSTCLRRDMERLLVGQLGAIGETLSAGVCQGFPALQWVQQDLWLQPRGWGCSP